MNIKHLSIFMYHFFYYIRFFIVSISIVYLLFQVLFSYNIKHPYSITILGNNLYWDDWRLSTIETGRKLPGGGRSTLKYYVRGIMELKAFGPSSQAGTQVQL